MGFFKKIGSAISDAVQGKGIVGDVVNPIGAGLNQFGIGPGSAMDSSYLPIAAGTGLGMMFGNPMVGAQIGAGVYSGQQAAQAQRDANAQNIALAQQQMMFSAQQANAQMAFQERMSSSAISRAKADMLSAGINPMLAPTAQMSTPGGAMGSYTAAHVDPIPSVAAYALNSAKDALSTFSSFKKDLASANASDAAADLARAQIPVNTATAKQRIAETAKTQAQTPAAQLEGRVAGWINKFIDALSIDAKNVSQKGLWKGLQIK